jgi:hypothetical protein
MPLSPDDAPPPLLKPIHIERSQFARNLTATQIADIGSAHFDKAYLERFRQSVLRGQTVGINRVTPEGKQKDRVSPRILGDIVHEALRWWRFPDDHDDMEAELTSYAWKHGVVDPNDLIYAVNTARGWLQDIRYTSIYRWVEKSARVYRELPFIYRTDRRIIHGIIDLLFERDDGTWVIVDYKSGSVAGYSNRTDDAAERENLYRLGEHAKRYYLQVGIYAASVEQYLSSIGVDVNAQDLNVYIYYLRYKHTIPVQYAQWTQELGKLETLIGNLIEDDS